jgi:hypothetical protein
LIECNYVTVSSFPQVVDSITPAWRSTLFKMGEIAMRQKNRADAAQPGAEVLTLAAAPPSGEANSRARPSDGDKLTTSAE